MVTIQPTMGGNVMIETFAVVVIGGLGSLLGSFLGAALIYILPIMLRFVPPAFGLTIPSATVEHLTFMVVGALMLLVSFFAPLPPQSKPDMSEEG